MLKLYTNDDPHSEVEVRDRVEALAGGYVGVFTHDRNTGERMHVRHYSLNDASDFLRQFSIAYSNAADEIL